MTPRQRPWLTRNLVVLSLVSLTQDAASELMYPLMPLFLVGVLAAPPVVLGIVEGLAELTAGVTKYLAGTRSDHVGRRRFITAGYGLAGLGKVIVAASATWPTVLLGRTVDRVGKGIRSAPRDAMITASTDAEHFSRAIGFHRSADTLGAVIGPIFALIGLSLLDGDVRAVMWWAVLPAMASIALSLLIRESPAVRVPPGLESQLPLPRSFWVAAGPLIAVQLVNLPDTLLLLRLSELGASTTQVVLAYIAFNAVYTLAAYPAGAIAANLRPARVYAVGLAAFAVAYMGLGIATSATPAVFLLVALYGMFPALTDGIGKSMVAHSAPRSIHGKAQGVYQSLAGAGILIAGTWGGLAWHGGHGGGSVPFLVAGVSGAVAALYFTVAKRYRPS